MFLDEVKIKVKSGTGGNGIVAFRREKFVAFGGAFGGSGGAGGSVIFEVDNSMRTLVNYRFQKHFFANNGENGKTKAMHGKNADDLILKVPPGTIIKNQKTNEVLADLKFADDKICLVKGGRGGRGNFDLAKRGKAHLEICENGEPGEELDLFLELKLISDVGLVGLPSVGKSTFLHVVSKARPKIAEYHFTTVQPNLGVVKTIDDRSYVVADLPGLIKNASLGKGMGIKFLKHIQRTKVIVHIIDMAATEARDPIEDYEVIRQELKQFDPLLLKRDELIIANKSDIVGFSDNLHLFQKKYPDKKIYSASLKNRELDKKVLVEVANMIEQAKTFDTVEIKSNKIYKFKEEIPFEVTIENNTFYVSGNKIEKLVQMTNFTKDDNLVRFMRQLKSLGIEEKLIEMGIKNEDVVNICGFEFEYFE